MLKYIGDGEHITGIPAQDLTDDDIKRIARQSNVSASVITEQLINTKLYELPKAPKKPKPEQTKD